MCIRDSAEAFLRQVIPDKVRHVAYDSEIDGPAWQANPTLVFRQLSIADKSPTAGRGFGA